MLRGKIMSKCVFPTLQRFFRYAETALTWIMNDTSKIHSSPCLVSSQSDLA